MIHKRFRCRYHVYPWSWVCCLLHHAIHRHVLVFTANRKTIIWKSPLVRSIRCAQAFQPLWFSSHPRLVGPQHAMVMTRGSQHSYSWQHDEAHSARLFLSDAGAAAFRHRGKCMGPAKLLDVSCSRIHLKPSVYTDSLLWNHAIKLSYGVD